MVKGSTLLPVDYEGGSSYTIPSSWGSSPLGLKDITPYPDELEMWSLWN